MPLSISKAEAVPLVRLCKNRDIIITRPDKGNGCIKQVERDNFRNFKLYNSITHNRFYLPDWNDEKYCQSRYSKTLVYYALPSLGSEIFS